jgi:cytoskeletal protein CcmA (bactofilin family)
MSVFRNPNNPRPEVPGRFGDPTRVDTSNDLLNRDQPEEERPAPTSTYTPFAEREGRSAPTDADKCANVIAAGSKWNGSLNIDDSVRIEGQLSGEVVAKGTVHIADGARVDAKVRAAFVIVNGSFKGEVRCSERLELMPKSRVEGAIITKLLTMHEGAIIDGSIQMTQDRPATAEKETPAPATRTRENGRATAAAEPAASS